MERKLMGPGSSGFNNISDDENNSLSSASMKTRSPLQLYENPGKRKRKPYYSTFLV